MPKPKNKNQIHKNNQGFTLVELIIAVGLFIFIIFISTNIFIDVVTFKKDLTVYNNAYRDLRYTVDFISDKAKNSHIDYEEYFSSEVSQGHKNPLSLAKSFYGVHHGVYASRFYDPGQYGEGAGQWGDNPTDLGVICNSSVMQNINLDASGNPTDSCNVVMPWSADNPTPTNPFKYNDADPRGDLFNFSRSDKADAFCDNQSEAYCADPNRMLTAETNELYLLDAEGKVKTIIGRKLFADDRWVVGMLELEGKDLDQNGLYDLFVCKEEYNCSVNYESVYTALGYLIFLERQPGEQAAIDFLANNNVSLGTRSDLLIPYNPETSHFVPISSLDLNILDLKFLISPIEDPFLAQEEYRHLQAPSVTMIIKAENSLGEIITIQNTIGTIFEPAPVSYPPVNDSIRALNLPHWMLEGDTNTLFGPLPQDDPLWKTNRS